MGKFTRQSEAPAPAAHRGASFLQLQIRQVIVTAIEEGQLPLGVRMPSSRDLAAPLKVSRNTIVIASEQLVDQNFLVSRERSGYFIAGLPKQIDRAKPPATEAYSRRWNERSPPQPTIFRNIVKPLDWQIYPSLFPTNDCRERARPPLSVPEINNWARNIIDGDDPARIERLQRQVLPRPGYPHSWTRSWSRSERSMPLI